MLELEDVGGADDAPVAVRLRQALKGLLRAFALKCVRAEEATHGEGQA